MSNTMSVEWLAKEINNHVNSNGLFWACGLIRETINLWKKSTNYNLLDGVAKTMANHYMEVTQ